MPRYRVNLDRLDRLVGEIAQVTGRIDTSLTELAGQVDQLQTTWDGDAADAYRDAHGRWVAGAEQMRDGLDDLRAVAKTAHSNYTSAIEANRRMWP